MLRSLLAVLAIGLAAAPAAHAADPLLSGYGGPGGNEQSVLIAPSDGGGGGGGSGSASAATSSAAAPVRPAAPLTSTPGTAAAPSPADAEPSAAGAAPPSAAARDDRSEATPSRSDRRSPSRRERTTAGAPTRPQATTQQPAATSPPLVIYRDAGAQAAPLIGVGGIALALLGVLALGGLLVVLRRLAPDGATTA